MFHFCDATTESKLKTKFLKYYVLLKINRLKILEDILNLKLVTYELCINILISSICYKEILN